MTVIERDMAYDMLVYQVKQELRTGGRSEGGRSSAVVRLVDRILQDGIRDGASDIHLEPEETGLRLRYRFDGRLVESPLSLPLAFQGAMVARLKVMAELDIAQKQKPQDGHIRFDANGKTVDLRVSCVPVIGGEAVVVRVMNGSGEALALGDVGFSEANLARFRGLIHRPAGLILICGPMNSGKTTTLYAALGEIGDASRSLVTIEDPVERRLAGVRQIELNVRAGLTFAEGLRAILRQDAQTILLGEVRDEETAQMAVRAALTGHLLMTTLHTPDAPSAVHRLLDMCVKPYLLAGVLGGVCAQRLVRRLCPHCREAYDVTSDSAEAAVLGRHWREGMRLYRAKGCPACHGRGYKGRIALQEVLTVSRELRNRIRAGVAVDELRDLARKEGMVTLREDGIMKATAGLTSLEEVNEVVYGGE